MTKREARIAALDACISVLLINRENGAESDFEEDVRGLSDADYAKFFAAVDDVIDGLIARIRRYQR